MTNFYSVHDVQNIEELLEITAQIKADPYRFKEIGKHKCLVLLFFNPSLRTKLSTQKAALNLGMHVIQMDMKDSWTWEFADGNIMNLDKAEHVKEAAQVIAKYADIIAIRSFPGLTDQVKDYEDHVIRQFISYCPKPVVNLESCIRHPLQSLADLFTITENARTKSPKIVLSWAPHPRSLPQAVSNSFLEWMHAAGHKVTVTHPPGYELDKAFMKGHQVEYDQHEAFKEADFVYVKNWSSLTPYGKVLTTDNEWQITQDKLMHTNHAKLMHCLPVRRNVVISDDAMDSEHSIIYDLAENRLHTAQAVLYALLKNR